MIEMTTEELDRRFTYHSSSPEQVESYQRIREAARSFAGLIHELCPDSEEKGVSVNQIDSAVFWANASIARYHG